MKFNISIDEIEEIALCIVHCNLNEDEACKYAKETLLEINGI
jgi:hypothetical protein